MHLNNPVAVAAAVVVAVLVWVGILWVVFRAAWRNISDSVDIMHPEAPSVDHDPSADEWEERGMAYAEIDTIQHRLEDWQ